MTGTPTPDMPQEATPGRRIPRWMWIVLVLSVAINLIIVGMALAALLHWRGGHGGGPVSRFERYVDELPGERRAKLKDMLDAHRDQVRPLRRQLRRARRRVRDAFVTEPFDRVALAKANADVTEARIALTKARQQWLPKLAESLTVEERRQYLRRVHRRRHRWRRRGD